MEENEIVLQAKEIHKVFTDPIKVSILQGVDLIVRKGDTVAITGRSGEGKSTLLHILGTLEKASKGSLEIAGLDASMFNKSKIRNQHVGFVFQSFHLLEDYNSLDNILMPARIARKDVSKGSEAYTRAWDLLNHVGLADRAYFTSKHLSGGEKQRIAIARALCNDPDILLADEPSGNLDGKTSDAIHDLLLGWAREEGKALVIVTHDESLASMCSKRYRLEGGQLIS